MSQQNATQNPKKRKRVRIKSPQKEVQRKTAVSRSPQNESTQQKSPPLDTASGLQQTIGNQAIGHLLIQRKLTLGPVGDKYEQEADAVAKQVVSHLSTSDQTAVQRQEEEELQMKPVQRQEEEELQMKPAILQRQEEEELQMKPVQRQEEEEEVQMKPAVQRQEEEELQMKPVQRQEEEEEVQMKPAVQRQEEEELQMKPVQRQEEEEEVQMKPAVQRQEEEEEVQMKPAIQRQEEEELQMKPVQRQEEEEEVQMKPAVQRQEEEELQMKSVQRQENASHKGGEVPAEVEQTIQSAQGSGQPLADNVRAPMENAFGADFSGVKVHTDSQSDTLNQSLQARAFTTGQDIFFRQGEYNPASSSGQELLAHELTHTIQQGGVQRHEAQEEQPASANVQRHPVGEELKEKDEQVAEISEKETTAPDKIGENGSVAPATTRTEAEEKSEKEEATKAGEAFTDSQKLTPGAMSLAAAEKILQGSYGDFKKIVPGTIVILENQAACAAKYDEVCIADGILRPDGSAWQPGDCAKDDAAAGVLTEGFAWKGVVYVNGETTLVTATAHEILHNNTEPNFRDKVGETFNEGVTETLARNALTEAGVTVPDVTAYPVQVSLTELLINLVGIDVVEKAYFDDVQELVTTYLNKGSGTWNELYNAAEALDTDGVKNALKPKSE